jgi:hypothetical protein
MKEIIKETLKGTMEETMKDVMKDAMRSRYMSLVNATPMMMLASNPTTEKQHQSPKSESMMNRILD